MSLSSVRSETALGRVPHLVAADSAFYSTKNEDTAKVMGVKRVCIPNRSTKSPERKREQKKHWFRNRLDRSARPSKPGDRAADALLLRCYTTI